jgi:hypothetical protein
LPRRRDTGARRLTPQNKREIARSVAKLKGPQRLVADVVEDRPLDLAEARQRLDALRSGLTGLRIRAWAVSRIRTCSLASGRPASEARALGEQVIAEAL